MSKHISIVGIGMGNPNLLTKEARCALLEADLIIGAKRMRGTLPKNSIRKPVTAKRFCR